MSTPAARTFYYAVKPMLPWRVRLAARRYLAAGVRRRSQATWPIDEATASVPAGWPGWPDGKQFALVLTHDVEGPEGLAKCRQLAEIEMQYGVRSSFNFVPEGEYEVPAELREWLTSNGFEVGVHDLHHDGKLYSSRAAFSRHAASINRYLESWDAGGYRSGFMLHNYDWHHDLRIDYDASSFDTDPFEPQPDAVRTIFPFWIQSPNAGSNGSSRAGYVELPYTLPQDSTLFFVLGEKTPDIWLRKLDWLSSKGGMALLNLHPDYVRFAGGPAGPRTYPIEHYTAFLKRLTTDFAGKYWNPTPRTLARWYRSVMPSPTPTAAPSSTPPASLRGKRAAVLLYSYYPADPRPRRAAEALVDAGMEVDLLCLREKDTDPLRETVNGVNVIRIPMSKRKESKFTYIWRYTAFVAGCACRLALRLPRRRYALVHAHNMPDFIAFGALPTKLNGARVILDLHDPMPELMTSIYGLAPGHWMVRALRGVERLSIGFANLALTPNIAFKKLFVSRGCPPHKMQIVMNSPQEHIFDPDRSAVASARNDGEFRIMHHGSIVHRHGIDLLVEALAQVKQTIPGVRLDIYGAYSPFIDVVLARAKELNVDERVHYHGPKNQSEIAEAIRACDLGVVPNRRSTFTETNFPTRLFEYLALHRPVIAPDTAGIKDYFGEKDIVYFSAGDAADLAEKIVHVWQNPTEVGEIVNRGREIYRQHLWSREKAHFQHLVANLL